MAHEPQTRRVPFLRKPLPSLLMVLVALNLAATGAATWKQFTQRQIAANRSPEWVRQRARRWALQSSECFGYGVPWTTDTRKALRLARARKKLLFLLSTNGDILSGRI